MNNNIEIAQSIFIMPLFFLIDYKFKFIVKRDIDHPISILNYNLFI